MNNFETQINALFGNREYAVSKQKEAANWLCHDPLFYVISDLMFDENG